MPDMYEQWGYSQDYMDQQEQGGVSSDFFQQPSAQTYGTNVGMQGGGGLLDSLLTPSFMSDVQTTFMPKQYNIAADEFTPGVNDQATYDAFLEMQKQGYQPTKEMADMMMLTGDYEKDGAYIKNKKTGELMTKERYTDQLKNMMNVDSGMFLSESAAAPNIFSQASLSQALARSGVEGGRAGMAKPMKLSSLRAIDPASFSAQVGQRRGSLADRLVGQRQSAAATGGDFAGYGGRADATNAAEEAFESGVQNIYGDVGRQRGQALQGLAKELADYQGLIKTVQGG